MSHADVLGMLVGPDNKELFLRRYWPDKHFVYQGNPERLADLLAIGANGVKSLLAMDRGQLRANGRTLKGEPCSVAANSASAEALYEAGFTLYFLRLQTELFRSMGRVLDQQLSLPPETTQVDAFASKRGPGLATHFDSDESFMVQLRGSKRWRVAPNQSIRYPSANYIMGTEPTLEMKTEGTGDVPDTMPAEHEVVTLRPGSVMFLPRGYWHDTDTVDEESLHLVVETKVPSWRDTLLYVLSHGRAIAGIEWRTPALDLWREGAVRPGLGLELASRLHALATRLAKGDPADLVAPKAPNEK
jgi:hypothetical protein